MSGLLEFLGDLLGTSDGGLGGDAEYTFDTEYPTDLADGSSLTGDNVEGVALQYQEDGTYHANTADTMDSGDAGRTDHIYFAGDSNGPSSDTDSSSESTGGGGRYPQGIDSAGDPVAQSGLGPPYSPKTGAPVDPNDVTWPDPVTGSIGSGDTATPSC
ncbi:hypothetical protein RU639_005970 [Aspergillus parasiticus]